MFAKKFTLAMLVMSALCMVASADTKAAPAAKLSATEIVDKNVAARGGLQAWRAVKTVTMSGKMDAGGNQRPTLPTPGVKRPAQVPQTPVDQVQLPFTMELARPRKQRLEIEFNHKTAVQVYDGTNGWKLRPFLNRDDVEPFTAEELKTAATQSDLDGPLVDYAAKGTKVELDGSEKVNGHDTYKLKLTMKDGQTRNVWIDSETFLEAKIEGAPRRIDGKYHTVEIYLKDFRPVNGLQFPHLLETKVVPFKTDKPSSGIGKAVERILIENVVVNPKLDEAAFRAPQSHGAVNATKTPKNVAGHSVP
jgi:outer membrane lipoprotein-sorting protein